MTRETHRADATPELTFRERFPESGESEVDAKHPFAQSRRPLLAGGRVTETQLADQVYRCKTGSRWILGLAGTPGSGKSSLAAALAERLNGLHGETSSVALSMDAFHMTNEKLAELGIAWLKGRPETFEVRDFIVLLQSIRAGSSKDILCPIYSRVEHNPVPDRVRIAPSTRIVIVEGSYLLLPTEPWCEIRELLDEVWFLDASDSDLRRRLVERHVLGGKTEEEALRRVSGIDIPNASLVRASISLATRFLVSENQ